MTADTNDGDKKIGSGTPTPAQTRARRLVVALDASRESLAVLEAAADLAARMQAEIQGLFVEDTDLLGLADDPLVRSFSLSGRPQNFNADSMARALRRHMRVAQDALNRAVATRRIHGSFEVRRGRIAVSMVEETSDHDLIVVCRSGGSYAILPHEGRLRTGTAVRELVRNAQRSVLILNEQAKVSGDVFVVYDGSDEARKALRTAAEIADRRGTDGIKVLLGPVDDRDENALRESALAELAGSGHAPVFQTLPDSKLDALCAAVSTQPGGMLVLGSGQSILRNEDAQALLEKISCSVLLVR